MGDVDVRAPGDACSGKGGHEDSWKGRDARMGGRPGGGIGGGGTAGRAPRAGVKGVRCRACAPKVQKADVTCGSDASGLSKASACVPATGRSGGMGSRTWRPHARVVGGCVR
ncbi:hypothetical protein GCM10008960_41460 [Deinococcus sedimenti]|uniref:Uncharacterized protein n=1 Tax=Deinococcus sedimenti TaxID=1867090 RepID=A0ABQ2S9J1_9DEIO|nr:hypothetical protein GCM10008960_41460 [Deinococcus sedimenti]